MTNPNSDKHFLGKLTVPVHACMMKSVVEYSTQIGRLLSLDNRELSAVNNAVEEAFCNAVTHFSGQARTDDHIHVEFVVVEASLIISIREKGIPFGRRKTDRFFTDKMEREDKPGHGMMLMTHGMDKVEHLINGREGKETRLTKHLKAGALPEELSGLNIAEKRPGYRLKKEAVIRLTKPAEFHEVMRLAWQCYGYTHEAFIYDLDTLTRKVKDNEVISLVAIDPDRNALIGHIGLKHHDPAVKVPELSLAFVDPAYRNSGLALSLGRKAMEVARETHCSGMFDSSVTTHTFSQQGMQTIGSRPCGLFMCIAASGMQARQLATSNQEKGSVVNHYYAFDRSSRRVYVPSHHQDMAAQIYAWLELPRQFESGDPRPVRGLSRIRVVPMPKEHNAAFIVVQDIGRGTALEVAEALRECKRKRMDAVYSFLPLENPSLPALVEQFEGMGLSFAGIMPHIHDGQDRLLMQTINIPFDPDAIKVYGTMTQKLFDYILKEQDRLE